MARFSSVEVSDSHARPSIDSRTRLIEEEARVQLIPLVFKHGDGCGWAKVPIVLVALDV